MIIIKQLIVEKTGVFTENRIALESFWNENKFEMNQLQLN